MHKENVVTLNDDELAILIEAANDRKMPIDKARRQYSDAELSTFGVTREHYSADEIRQRGFSSNRVLTSFDEDAKRATRELQIGAPFAKNIRKWQLPIDLQNFHMVTTVFPPNTVVEEHVHPALDSTAKSGGYRIVVTGSIIFKGVTFMPGDWFFIPNGVPYSFATDPIEETTENYWYEHIIHATAVRFSAPKSTNEFQDGK